MSSSSFYELSIKKINPEAAGAVAITFEIPVQLRENFLFEPGQFLTVRTTIQGNDIRRNYSVSSPRSKLIKKGELEIGIRPVQGGFFSNWAVTELRAGDKLKVMPPNGSFISRKPQAIHRIGFAAGSGITPILSIAATTLEEQFDSKFTLIYGNRKMSSVMFNESLQDLKDRFPDRFTMIHLFSQQVQEVDLFMGRIDDGKIKSILSTLISAKSMDEVFICGPEAMIEVAEKTLIDCGVPAQQIYSERFTTSTTQTLQVQADVEAVKKTASTGKQIALTLILDGKEHMLNIRSDEQLLDAALNAGLDLPFSCKAGVCSTCRCKVLEGHVTMDKNFTLESDEISQGFALSCQARATTEFLTISFDHR
jgi:ring-1,2-phenylacetyl-CoA epoxidase subunit PaaE